jgi:hypothetical protein
MHFSSPPCVLHDPLVSSSLIWHPNNIWWSLQVMKPVIIQCSPASRHFLPFRFNKTVAYVYICVCACVRRIFVHLCKKVHASKIRL